MSELLSFILSHEDSFKSKSRLTSLYSDFALLKTTNPDGYRANVSAWTSAFTNASRAGLLPGKGKLTIKIDTELLAKLEIRNLGRPAALQAVAEDAVASRAMIPLQEYLNATTSIYSKRWINFHLPTPWQVAKWGFEQIGLVSSSLAQGDLVILSNVQAASKAIQANISASSSTATSQIYSLETFTTSFSSILSSSQPLTQADVSILLIHLTRDTNAASMLVSPTTGLTTIKFSPANTTPRPITPHDETIAHLQTLSHRLNTQVNGLHATITTLDRTARHCLSTSPPEKSRALSALRTKKAAQATLEKRQASLDQVTAVLTSIDDAASQVEMVSAMEASTGVLRDLNKQVGGVERVESVMEGLREGMAEVDEVAGVIGEVGLEGVGAEDGEVEEELESLLMEQRRKEDLERKTVEEAEAAKHEAEEERLRTEMLAEAPSVPTAIKENVREEKTEEASVMTGSAVSGSNEDDLMTRMKMLSVNRSDEDLKETRKSQEDAG